MEIVELIQFFQQLHQQVVEVEVVVVIQVVLDFHQLVQEDLEGVLEDVVQQEDQEIHLQ
jgi:hypothetical protein